MPLGAWVRGVLSLLGMMCIFEMVVGGKGGKKMGRKLGMAMVDRNAFICYFPLFPCIFSCPKVCLMVWDVVLDVPLVIFGGE